MKKRLFTSVKAIIAACLTASLLFFNATSIFAQYTKLLDLEGLSNGSSPYFGELYSDGTFLYGMTLYGGINNLGTVFRINTTSVGITPLSLGKGLVRIYPNPTSGMVNINISNQNLVNVKVYNPSGELLQEYFTADFSIVNFPSGIYFVTTQTDKSTFINTLIKE